jgi:glycosyltransferase involved in cell wall biosynthesis
LIEAEAQLAQANVSVFVMTLDEEANIERCLGSVQWSNDIVVLDSLSRDRTVELARGFAGVRVFTRPFEDFSSQRNFGLRQIEYRNPWLLMLDADEEVPVELAAEILAMAGRGSADPHDAYLLRRAVIFEGKRLLWNLTSTVWIARLLRPPRVHFEGVVHERAVFPGTYGLLRGRLDHHLFHKGLEDWRARRVSYARAEARTGSEQAPGRPSSMLGRGAMARHLARKALFRRLPAPGVIYFLSTMLFRWPFLDGLRGLRYVLLEARSYALTRRMSKEATDA